MKAEIPSPPFSNADPALNNAHRKLDLPPQEITGAPALDPAEGIPDGYLLDRDGLYEMLDDGNLQRLCSPLRVVAQFHNEAGSGWGRIVQLVDPQGKLHDIPVLDRDLHSPSSTVRSTLTDHGLKLESYKGATTSFLRLLKDWTPPQTVTSTPRTGWACGTSSFVLPDGRVLGDHPVVYLGSPRTDDGRSSAGSLEAWRKRVSHLCLGNPNLVLGLSVAFAAPLLELLGEESSGIHFRGASSRGKSTLLRAAVSVWGPPGELQSWRSTANGLESVAQSRNGTLLALDEIGEIDGKELDQAIYMLANGTGKARAGKSGRGTPVAHWRLAMLSSGEVSVADQLRSRGARPMPGQAVRLIDLDADQGRHGVFEELHGHDSGAAFAEELKRASAECYGTAGPALVTCVLDHRAATISRVRNFVERYAEKLLMSPLTAGAGEEDRVARRFALIAAAGCLASQFGQVAWDRSEVLRVVQGAFQAWLRTRRAPTPEAAAAVERVRVHLLAERDRFLALKDGIDEAVNGTLGWFDGEYFYVPSRTWQRMLGRTAIATAQHLRDAGLLLPGEGTNLARRAPREIGHGRMYMISASILATAQKDGSAHLG